MLHREHGSGTAVARLNLIVNQQHAVLLKQRLHFAEIRRDRHNHAAVALDRFHDHCSNLIAFFL
ncbi:hypothetical protein D3C73_1576010 [compost metagenome]